MKKIVDFTDVFTINGEWLEPKRLTIIGGMNFAARSGITMSTNIGGIILGTITNKKLEIIENEEGHYILIGVID